MKYSVLGRTGIPVSVIAYGGIVSTMGKYSQYTYDGDGQKASDEYVSFALDNGINYFDVAPVYGDAQERLGNSIKEVRNSIILACKTGCRDYEAAAREAEQSLNFFGRITLTSISFMPSETKKMLSALSHRTA